MNLNKQMKPTRWSYGDLLNFLELKRGHDLPLQDRRDGEYPIIGSNGVTGFHNEAISLSQGVITGRSGTLGKVYFSEKPYWPLNTSLYIVDFKGNAPKYCYYFLKHFPLEKFGTGTGVPTLNRNIVHKQKVVFPPVLEQQKIAEILSTVDKKIDLIDQKIAETEKLKTGLMQKLFSEGVGVQDENGEWQPHTEFQYDSLLGKKPKSWQAETLGNILDIASSKRIKREEYVNEGVPFYRSKEIILKSKQLSFTPEIFISRERFDKLSGKFGSPQQGDILISAVGTIGAIYRVRDEEFYFKDGNLLWIRNIDKSRLSSEFLECYLRSYLCQEMLANLSAGSSQNALTIVKLSKLPLIIPTKDEQKMIVSIISSINQKIYLLKAQKSETQQLKKGLMQKLLTGEWRVPVEETEAA
ncbi:restriction endonuclease subunit S [Shewanella algae]|uniref:restriction endonuclease subunit S n=1 Tax=Shewanella algae TaxID=38313 RepID=UPI0031F4ECD6